MTAQEFREIGEEALELLRSLAPFKTGNLRYNAIKIEWINSTKCKLWVDQAIAPYMPYTNEEWEHKLILMGNFVKGETVERMRTWNNPNEGWFDRAARAIAEFIAEKTGGSIK